ncbi:hypothetical protein [Streptomyces apricus]|uniref:Uncharacterized protein n=1 Tax=Streptomyces apricus TaxID=1828112 RepID=A0A5B0AZ73_9ACTN|nr:hypothetical protein [Streptomyces apricus]KAA0935310.1 hypothetical protein FGF04_14515 [Streptomyces apricus]
MAELQALLRVSNERALSRLTSRIVRDVPLDLGEGKSREYWKDDGLRDVRFPILLREGLQPGDMLCGILAGAWEVAGPWTVLSVGEPFVAGWEFVAIADHRNAGIKIPGVEWMRISLLLESPER